MSAVMLGLALAGALHAGILQAPPPVFRADAYFLKWTITFPEPPPGDPRVFCGGAGLSNCARSSLSPADRIA
jgi:hypothetical protein